MANKDICKMFEVGTAIKLHIPEHPKLPEGYTQKEGLVLCNIDKDQCPHENTGTQIYYPGFPNGTTYICNTNGLKH